MRRLFSRALLGALLGATALTLPALSVSAQAAQSVALAHDATATPESSGTYRWADQFLKGLQAKGWKTESFPKDTIGGEDERLDQIRTGILDMTMSDFAKAAQFAPDMRVLQLPYTFADIDQEFRFVTQSKFLDEINAELAGKDLRVIAIVPNGGFLGIFNAKQPVHTVADMEGLRMRALDQNQLAMFQMMGASGVVIPFSEVPNAIQTGIADGYINSAGVPLAFGQAELFKHYSDAKVLISARLALASKAWWDGLSADEQQQVRDAALDASREVFGWAARTEQAQEDGLTAAGITVYNPSAAEVATFHDATVGMRQTLKDVPLERVEAILNQIDSYRK
jgi:TRAP-type C4-dicarboxylate transport system substrate-binding protein